MKWIGVMLGALTLGWTWLQKEDIAGLSLIAGIAIASSFYILLSSFKTEKMIPALQNDEKIQWQLKLEESESRASQAIDGLHREIQKLEQKTLRAEERCQSYQKLVEVHQQEIEKLRHDNHHLGEQVIAKERRLNEFYLSKIEPDLFDTERREVETLNRELKKQLSYTKNELAELSKDVKKKKKNSSAESKLQLESRDLLS